MSKKSRWMFLTGIVILITAAVASFLLKEVGNGDTVKLNYTLMLDDGTIYYTTAKSAPLRVTLGEGVLLPGFEEALVGMHRGETKFLTIPAEQAYGAYRTDLIQIVEREQFPDGAQPAIGQQFDAELLDGSPTLAIVTAATDKTVTLDANHPLAGQNLNFEIEVISIERNATPMNSMNMLAGWILLVIGAGSAFVFFNIRKKRGYAGLQWPGLSRRAVSPNYRRS